MRIWYPVMPSPCCRPVEPGHSAGGGRRCGGQRAPSERTCHNGAVGEGVYGDAVLVARHDGELCARFKVPLPGRAVPAPRQEAMVRSQGERDHAPCVAGQRLHAGALGVEHADSLVHRARRHAALRQQRVHAGGKGQRSRNPVLWPGRGVVSLGGSGRGRGFLAPWTADAPVWTQTCAESGSARLRVSTACPTGRA